jgi:hypothetical protein
MYYAGGAEIGLVKLKWEEGDAVGGAPAAAPGAGSLPVKKMFLLRNGLTIVEASHELF